MKLNSTIDLYAFGESAGTGGQSWLVHPPGLKTDTPVVRDMARRRLSKSNPDVDSAAVKCPRCGSTKYGLMPTDFETAKCSKCGKNFPAKSIDAAKIIRQYPKEFFKSFKQASALARKQKLKAAKYKEKYQSDESAFVGKPLRVQDTLYGHLVSEHDNESSAQQAMLSRPYARILRHQEPAFSSYNKKGRNAARKKLVNKSPDDIY